VNFVDIDSYIIFDLFVLVLIGMGPKIALVVARKKFGIEEEVIPYEHQEIF
jgi:hypothetical protein